MKDRYIIKISLLLVLLALMVTSIGCREEALTKQPATVKTACQAKAAGTAKCKKACQGKAVGASKCRKACQGKAVGATKCRKACQGKAAGATKCRKACQGKAAGATKDKAVCMRSALVGTWELTYESRRGTRVRKLIVNEDMTGTYEGRNSNTPITDLEIDGDQVSFKVERSYRDRKFTTEFKGKIDGSSFNGELTTSRGSRAFTGKKLKNWKG